MKASKISSAAIESRLLDIEASELVSPISCKILRWLVKTTLAGREWEIKAYSIATQVLGCPDTYNPKKDRRVQMRIKALREELSNYFSSARSDGGVLIALPILRSGSRTQYVPVLTLREQVVGMLAAQARLEAIIWGEVFTTPGLTRALQLWEIVLKDCPNNPEALVGKADAHATFAIHGGVPIDELNHAEQLATKAIEQSASAWEAYGVLGYVHAVRRHWSKAQKAFALALQLKPLNSPMPLSYCPYLTSRNRTEESIAILTGIVDAGKYASPFVLSELGFSQLLHGKFDDAIVTLNTVVNVHRQPQCYVPHLFLAMIFEAIGEPLKALEEIDKIALSTAWTPVLYGQAALFAGLAGQKARAKKELNVCRLAKASGASVPASQMAIAHLGVGEHEESVRWFKTMAVDCEPLTLYLGHLPFLRHLTYRADFCELLDDLGLPLAHKGLIR